MAGRTILLALGALVFGAVIMTWHESVAPAPATAPRPTAVPTVNACAGATEQVKRYRAPGASATVLDAITAHLATERRPVQVDGWYAPEARSGQCDVRLGVYLGNELKAPTWRLDPRTGRVEALDTLAKQLSGWD